jgi:hypothetical protein
MLSSVYNKPTLLVVDSQQQLKSHSRKKAVHKGRVTIFVTLASCNRLVENGT